MTGLGQEVADLRPLGRRGRQRDEEDKVTLEEDLAGQLLRRAGVGDAIGVRSTVWPKSRQRRSTRNKVKKKLTTKNMKKRYRAKAKSTLMTTMKKGTTTKEKPHRKRSLPSRPRLCGRR